MTLLRKVLSILLITLVILTSVKYIFLPKQAYAADVYLGLNEGYGTSSAVNDVNGSVAAGSITGATWKAEEFCKAGKCIYFDGSGDKVAFSDDTDLDFTATNTFTITGWFRHPIIATNPDYFVTKHQSTVAGGYKLYMDSDGDMVFGVDDDGTWDTTDIVGDDQSKNFDDNKWHHVAAVKNGTTGIYLYVDGVLIDQDVSLAETGSLANAASFYIGIDADGSSNAWDGFIDEVKVVRTARTATEIATDFLGSTTSATGDGPVAYWKMDEGSWTNDCSTDSAFDSSGNANHGDSCPNTTGPAGGAAGKYGSAGDFDGSDDYVLVQDANSLDVTNNFTITAWVNADTLASGEYYIVSKDGVGTDTTDAYNFFLQAGGRVCYETNNRGNSICSISSQINTGTWYHVAIVFDDAFSALYKAAIYINGVKMDYYQPDGKTTQAPVALTTNLLIGRRGNSGSQFDGKIDDVRIYNYSRSQVQVFEDMVANPPTGLSASFGPTQDYLSNGLVGYWKMDETATPATDYSGNGNSGTWQGSPAAAVGKFGNGISLDGSTQYISGSNSTSLTIPTSVTVSAWVYRDTTSTTDNIIDFSASGETEATNYLYRIHFSSTNYLEMDWEYGAGSNNDTTSSTTVSPTSGAWTHITVVRDDIQKTVTFYQNGSQLGTTQTYTNSATGGTSSTLWIGSASSGTTQQFDGTVDEVRVYNRALSPTEVTKLYNWAPGPVGHWKMDENTGTNAFDSSSNGNVGTITSGAGGWNPGKYGSSYNFDNADSSINAQSGSTLDKLPAMTVEFWMYPKGEGENGNAWIVNKADTGTTSPGDGWGVAINDGANVNALEFKVDWSTTHLERNGADNTHVLNKWQHVAVTWDGSSTCTNIHIYVDAREVAYGGCITPGSGSRFDDSSTNLFIGNNYNSSRTFDGNLDDVRIYNYVRTQGQIVEDMNAGHPAPGSPVGSATSYWKFDEGNSTTAYDGSVNANNLTLSSASWTASGKFGMAWNGTGSVWAAQAADDEDHDFTASQDFTISAWIRSDSATNPSSETQYIIGKGTITNAGTVGYTMYANTSGNVVFGIKDDTAWGASSPTTPSPDDTATSTSDLYDGEWHHVVATKTGTSRIDLYVDGQLNASDTSLAATGTLANSIVLRLGDDDADATNSFAGNIDEVKIYRQAISAEQVKVEFNRGLQASAGAGTQGTFNDPRVTASTPPTSGTNDTSYGSIAWTNPTNIYVSENTRATLRVNGTTASNYLSARTFGFSIPSDATIKGITVAIERIRTAGAGTGNVRDNVVSMVKGGTVTGDNKAATGTNWPTSEGTATYGSSADLWGTTWTPTDINASNFGMVLAVAGAAAGANRIAEVDQVLITVAYTVPYTATVQSQARGYCVPGDSSICDAPIGHWKLDENTGQSAFDSSGNNLNGQLGATSGVDTTDPVWTTGNYGAAGQFDGTDDYIVATDPGAGSVLDITGSFTLEYWINPSSWPTAFNWKTVLAKDANGNSGYFSELYNSGTNEINCGFAIGASIQEHRTTTFNGVAGNWYHFACVFDDTNNLLKMYKNGVQIYSAAESDGSPTADNDALRIGSSQYAHPNQYFAGKIDDVRIYNYARTPAQIAWDMNQGKTVGWYRFDEGSGTSANDSSGFGNTGTLTNTPTWTTGKLNGAISFAGSNQHVTRADDSDFDFVASESFTITGWFKHNTASATETLVTKLESSGTDGGYKLKMESDGDITCETDDDDADTTIDDTTTTTLATYDDNSWHHVACVYDTVNTDLILYIDGRSVASDTSTTTNSLANDDALFIGIESATGTEDWVGELDDVRMYRYPLTSAQITSVISEGAVRFGPVSGSP